MAMTYQNADAQLTGRCKDRRKVANNTYLERRDDHTIALRLHATDILIFTDDNRIRYESGGWKTPTTKQRMTEFGPLRLWSDRGIWWYSAATHWTRDNDMRGVYADGMVYCDGVVSGAGADPKAEKKARARVTKYCRDFMTAFVAGQVPAPSGGDCWYCGMRVAGGTDAGKPLGEAMPTLHEDGSLTTERASHHIESHIEEKYYVPSLLHRALEVGGESKSMWWWVGAYWDATAEPGLAQSLKDRNTTFERPRVERALRKYVLGQMGMVR